MIVMRIFQRPFFTLIALAIASSIFSYGPPDNWAVLPFEVGASLDCDLGDFAAKKYSAELSKTPQYQAIGSDVIDRALLETNLRLPIRDKFKIIRLGESLKCYSIVTGKIDSIKVEKAADGLEKATATLTVKVHDTVSGEIVNSAEVAATSSAAESDYCPSETLSREAVEQAVFEANREILAHTLNEAYVQNVVKNEAVISLGASNGYREGLRVVIRRGPNFVCFGRVIRVETDSATIKATFKEGPHRTKGDQKGLCAEDRVRPIIENKPVVKKKG
jgi:hypothetical protein